MLYNFKNKKPDVLESAFIAPSADIVGDVTLGKDSSVWHQATIRGDIEPIKIGKGSNVQEQCTLHVDIDTPLNVGDNVTLGHGVILHGCTIEDGCLIGMGATVLNNAVIGENSIVGAGALVTEGKVFPPNSLIIGSPAKAVKELNEDAIEKVKANAELYVELAGEMAKSEIIE